MGTLLIFIRYYSLKNKGSIVKFLEENICFGKGKNFNGEIPLEKIEKAFYKDPIEIPLKLKEQEKIVDVFCGFRQSFFISNSNKIYCSGYNKFGELGILNNSEIFCYFSVQENSYFYEKKSKIMKIETGQKFTCLMDCKKRKEFYLNFQF